MSKYSLEKPQTTFALWGAIVLMLLVGFYLGQQDKKPEPAPPRTLSEPFRNQLAMAEIKGIYTECFSKKDCVFILQLRSGDELVQLSRVVARKKVVFHTNHNFRADNVE